MKKRLSHYDSAGQVSMVDVGGKEITQPYSDCSRLCRDGPARHQSVASKCKG